MRILWIIVFSVGMCLQAAAHQYKCEEFPTYHDAVLHCQNSDRHSWPDDCGAHDRDNDGMPCECQPGGPVIEQAACKKRTQINDGYQFGTFSPLNTHEELPGFSVLPDEVISSGQPSYAGGLQPTDYDLSTGYIELGPLDMTPTVEGQAGPVPRPNPAFNVIHTLN